MARWLILLVVCATDQLVSLMPCALFFPWPLASMHASLSLLYQFWIHTSLIPRTPTFELVFNSASLHRIHHVRNQDQLGKNYGAILSVIKLDNPARAGVNGHSSSYALAASSYVLVMSSRVLTVFSCRFGTDGLVHCSLNRDLAM